MRNSQSYKAAQVSPEVRAFIYQQINEFENVLPEGCTVGVFLQEGHEHILATIEIKSVGGHLISRGIGEEPIEALVDAKNAMNAQLEDIQKVVRLREIEFSDAEEGSDEDKAQVEPVQKVPKYRH